MLTVDENLEKLFVQGCLLTYSNGCRGFLLVIRDDPGVRLPAPPSPGHTLQGRGRRRGRGVHLRLRAAPVAPPPPPPSPRTCHWNRRSARGPRLAGWREAGGVGAVKGARVRGNRRREREGARSSARSRPGGGVRGGGRGRGAPARTTWPGGGAWGGAARPVKAGGGAFPSGGAEGGRNSCSLSTF